MSSRVDSPPSSYTPKTPKTSTATSDEGESELPNVTSTHRSISQLVFERRAEYTRSYKTKVKVGTWNVASLSGTEKDIGGWFVDGKGVSETLSGFNVKGVNDESKDTEIESVGSQEGRRSKKESTIPRNDNGSLPGGNEIGIYVLGLQEIVDISSIVEAIRPHTDPLPAQKWKRAVEEALPKGYQRVAEQQLIGLFLVIYASPSITPTISSVSTTSVGTGIGGYMGNKGAVAARIILGETTRMVFINCHLTAGIENGRLDRRNWDSSQILQKTRFDPVYNGGGVMEEFGEEIGDEDFAFWFGDLNYRLESMAGDDVRRLLMLHTQKEYDIGQTSKSKIDDELSTSSETVTNLINKAEQLPYHEKPFSESFTSVADSSLESSASPNLGANHTSEPALDPASDPTSLQTTLASLLPHDQLHMQMRTGKAFSDGWREGAINFLPTYKYDVGSVGMFDSSEKRRGPSWCDRILYRTRKDRLEYVEKLRNVNEIKRRDEEMKARGIDESSVEDDSLLFEYDPETDGMQDDCSQEIKDDIDPSVVMTKSGFEDKLELDYYTSHQRVLSSDHKPLDAVFILTYDAVDPDLKSKVHQDVVRQLDKAENEGRPNMTVVIDHPSDKDDDVNGEPSSSNFEGVDFGHVRYHHRKTRNITIANTGRVPATVGFIDRSTDQGHSDGIHPSWLQINFDRISDNQNSNPNALHNYTIQPGDAVNVEFVLLVTDTTQIRRLNEGLEGIEDVLVLRIYNGRDYFLPIRGIWLQSVFSRSVDKLIRMPESGVRRLQHQRPDGHGSGSHGDKGVKWSAPRELFRLTEAIEVLVERSIAEWGMKGERGSPPWEGTGWPFAYWAEEEKQLSLLKESVREALDLNEDFATLFPPETGSVLKLQAMAAILLDFLRSLEDGIIPAPIWTDLETAIIERERSKRHLTDEETRTWILESLSPSSAHITSFTFITFMLTRVATEIAPMSPQAATIRSSLEILGIAEQPQKHHEARKRRRETEEAFAALFAEAMIRVPEEAEKGRDKDKKASQARRKEIVAVFLREPDS